MKNSARETLETAFTPSQWWANLSQMEVAGQRVGVLLVLGAVLALALFLRLTGINWDSFQHMNPDERHSTNVGATIDFPSNPINYFNTAESPLNPYNNDFPEYVWGTFPLFFTKGAAEALDALPFVSPDVGTWSDYGHLNLVGRTLSAFVDIGSIIFLFLLGSYLFNRRVGLLAAFLLSVTVLHIQHSHFFVVDGYLAFFSLASLYFAVRAAKQGGQWNFALAGAMFGLAMASKVSAIPLAVIITMAAAIYAWPALKERWTQNGSISLSDFKAGPLKESAVGLALAAVVAVIAFRVAQPYSFESFSLTLNPIWRDDVTEVLQRQTGEVFYPPSWHWAGRVPWLYPLQNMILWGMGVPLFIAAAVGLLYAGWRVVRHREVVLLLLLTWILVTFFWQAGRFTSYQRYILPVYAPMVLLAAYVLVELWQSSGLASLPERLRRFRPRLNTYLPILAKGSVAAVVVLTLLYALAFTNVYRNPLTRVEASRWLYDNVPERSVIANFHWDDGLPLNVDGQNAGESFELVNLNLYDIFDADGISPDEGTRQNYQQRIDEFIGTLDRADYIAVSSDRLYRSIPRSPTVYATSTDFFDALFAEELGFEQAATFTSYPSLFGVTISDDGAEESLTVYDHPKVIIYEKTGDYSHDNTVELLGSPSANSIKVPPADAGQNGLLLRPDNLAEQRAGGTWTDIFDSDSFVNENSGFAWILWLLPVQALALAMVPLGLKLFRWLPDRGYLLTKPLGLLLMVYTVWLTVSLGWFEYTRGTILGVTALIVILGIALGVVWRQQVLDYVRQHWRSILLAEAIFLAAFLIFYVLRIYNPDLWHPFRGGEKPMDFAYLNAITRSTTLPPFDPWFAGGYINYYYFGQFITATLFKLTRILPEIGYNLAVPTFFALTVAATYSVGYNLTAAARGRIKRRPGGGRISGRSLVWAGLLAVLLALIVGNLHAIDAMADELSAISSVHLGSSIPILSGLVGSIGGLWEVVTGGAGFPTIDYWRPSRMMPPTPSITEFPFFSFLLADLHAHLMAIPFAVASLGVGLSLVLTGSGEKRPGRWISSARALALAALLGLVVGALRWTNSWDYPPFLLLGIAAVFIAERASEGRINWPMAFRAAVGSALLVVVSILTFYPFQQNYQQFQAGLHGAPETTVLRQYLSHFGLFFVIIAGLVTFLWARMLRRTELAQALRRFIFIAVGLVFATVALLIFAEPLQGLLPISVTNVSAGDFLESMVSVRIPEAAAPSFPVPLLPFAYLALAAITVLAWHELERSRPDSPLRLFVLAMLGMALGLSIGVDIVTIDNDIQRMNTVFKFYIHIWLLLALVSAFAVWYMLAVTRVRLPALKRAPRLQLHGLAVSRRMWATAATILFLGALLYPLSATPERLNDRFLDLSPTPNGLAFMEEAVYESEKGPVVLAHELEAIRWLRNNVEGSPVIIEAHTGPDGVPLYRWGSRFAVNTGLPTVIGWDWHQTQQRGQFASMIRPRQEDVITFYSDPDPAAATRVLQKYGVSYVIVGQMERLYYPESGFAKFDTGLDGALELVYENPGTRIYKVPGIEPAFVTSSD